MQIQVLTFGQALDERISSKSFPADTGRHVVTTQTHGSQSANIVDTARILALVVGTHSVRTAVGVQHTLGFTSSLRIAYEVIDTRADGTFSGYSTVRIRTARIRHARVVFGVLF